MNKARPEFYAEEKFLFEQRPSVGTTFGAPLQQHDWLILEAFYVPFRVRDFASLKKFSLLNMNISCFWFFFVDTKLFIIN